MNKEIYDKILKHFSLSDDEKKLVLECLDEPLNLLRLQCVLDTMIEYHMQGDILLPYILFQTFKKNPEKAGEFSLKLDKEQKKLFDIFVTLKDVRALTRSGEVENIRKMFVAIAQDMRIVLIKFSTILYDLNQIKLPLSVEDRDYVTMTNDIFAPLAERLGLMGFKHGFEDKSFELLYPEEFEKLSSSELLQTPANQEQIEKTKEKLIEILKELKIKGEIQARQKHLASIYKKLQQKKESDLQNIYDIVAMRVIVPTVEDCYSVLGKVHAIYKPMSERVKDYIANPKQNGYQSLHTTIIADNNRPLEIQIRTFEMHQFAEYGIAAHWIYKEKRAQNNFDQKLTWFRQMMENSEDLPPEEFLQNLKLGLIEESIFVQTPKGKVLELPLGATPIDFAYAIHTNVGNTCVGAKANGKMIPIFSALENGDVVEILTNPNSKGPSRDWLNVVKTNSARSKIRTFFKTEFKDENIRIGKSVFEQALKNKNLTISKQAKDDYLQKIAGSMMMEQVDSIFAEIGAGSLSVNSVIGRLINLYNKDKTFEIKKDVISVKKNADGVLIDGDSGLLVRYAGCCCPVVGDDIVGYISSGRGVTIHRQTCPNLKYLEKERLISAQWETEVSATFVAVIKIHTDIVSNAMSELNNIAKEFKGKLKGFGYKEIKDEYVFEIVVQISGKDELEKMMKSFAGLKFVRKIYRSE